MSDQPVSADGYRFTVDGWMHTSGRVELVENEIITWQWPDTAE